MAKHEPTKRALMLAMAIYESKVKMCRHDMFLPEVARMIDEIYAGHEELIVACEKLLGVNNPPAGEPGHVDYADAVTFARAALAKARVE